MRAGERHRSHSRDPARIGWRRVAWPLTLKSVWLMALLLLAAASVRGQVGVRGLPDESDFGPAPRTEAGRFINPSGDLDHGSFGVRWGFMWRRLGTAFRSGEGHPDRVANDGAFLRENARHSEPTVTWIGHATLLVQMEHVSFLTDPIWSERPSPISFSARSASWSPGLRSKIYRRSTSS